MSTETAPTDNAPDPDSDEAVENSLYLTSSLEAIEMLTVSLKPYTDSASPHPTTVTLSSEPMLAPLVKALQDVGEAVFNDPRLRHFTPLIRSMAVFELCDRIEADLSEHSLARADIANLAAAFTPDKILQDDKMMGHIIELARYQQCIYAPIILHDETVPWTPKIQHERDGHPMPAYLRNEAFPLHPAIEIGKRIDALIALNQSLDPSQPATFPRIQNKTLLAAIHDWREHLVDQHDQPPYNTLSRRQIVELAWEGISQCIADEMNTPQFRAHCAVGSDTLKDMIAEVLSSPEPLVVANTSPLVREPRIIPDFHNRTAEHFLPRTDAASDIPLAKRADREELISTLMAEISNTPITLHTLVGGKDCFTVTTLAESGIPIAPAFEAALHPLLHRKPIATASRVVFSEVCETILQQAASLIEIHKTDDNLTAEGLAELIATLPETYHPHHGSCARQLRQRAGFFSDIYDPVDLGMVYIPAPYDDLPTGGDDDETYADLLTSELEDSSGEPLHPIAEARKRLDAIITRIDNQQQSLFLHDYFHENPDRVEARLELIEHLSDALLTHYKSQFAGDNLYAERYDISPCSLARIFYYAAEEAFDPDISEADLAENFQLTSPFMRGMFAGALQHEPDTHIQIPPKSRTTLLDSKHPSLEIETGFARQ